MAVHKQALKRLSYGVYLVTAARTSGEGEREFNAMTMRMVSQISTRPPCLGIAVAKRRYTHCFIAESGVFVVNVLADGQQLLGGHFGLRSGRDFNKLAGVEYTAGQLGAPILAGCCAWLECKVVNSLEVGNSTLFVGEVVNSGASDLHPLVYNFDDYFC